MAHHRCTRCKQESETRHKYAGGLFCESCLKSLGVRGFGGFSHRGFSLRGMFGSLWDKIKYWAKSPFQSNQKAELRQAAVRFNVRYQVMRSRMLRIPANFAAGVPQKR